MQHFLFALLWHLFGSQPWTARCIPCTFDLCVAIKKWIVALSTGKMVTPRPSFCCCMQHVRHVMLSPALHTPKMQAVPAYGQLPPHAPTRCAIYISLSLSLARSPSSFVALIWKKFCAYLLKNSWRVLPACHLPSPVCCLLSVAWQDARRSITSVQPVPNVTQMNINSIYTLAGGGGRGVKIIVICLAICFINKTHIKVQNPLGGWRVLEATRRAARSSLYTGESRRQPADSRGVV